MQLEPFKKLFYWLNQAKCIPRRNSSEPLFNLKSYYMRGLAHWNGYTEELPWAIVPLCLSEKNHIIPYRNLNAEKDLINFLCIIHTITNKKKETISAIHDNLKSRSAQSYLGSLSHKSQSWLYFFSQWSVFETN